MKNNFIVMILALACFAGGCALEGADVKAASVVEMQEVKTGETLSKGEKSADINEKNFSKRPKGRPDSVSLNRPKGRPDSVSLNRPKGRPDSVSLNRLNGRPGKDFSGRSDKRKNNNSSEQFGKRKANNSSERPVGRRGDEGQR